MHRFTGNNLLLGSKSGIGEDCCVDGGAVFSSFAGDRTVFGFFCTTSAGMFSSTGGVVGIPDVTCLLPGVFNNRYRAVANLKGYLFQVGVCGTLNR